ncbi:MAG TPA: hypothetical protein VEY91_06185 [Candidatus Limnocylindria bacterium]|nr:hypothetical protein [Candidatus Limnocylindria bacterium]
MRSNLRILSLAVVGLGFYAAPGRSAEGIYLSWNDCPLDPSSAADFVSACNVNGGQSELLCSFSLAQPTDSVLAVEITLDVQHAAALLPSWWRFDTTPCRNGSLKADADFGSRSACEDMWHGAFVVGGLAQYTVGQPRGGPNQARIRIALAVTPASMQALNAATMHYAARVVIDNLGTVGATPCSGCGEPACLVLNAVMIGRPIRPEGAPSGNILLDSPGPGNPNWVTWQGGGGAACTAVPVARKTWGQVKTLYR